MTSRKDSDDTEYDVDEDDNVAGSRAGKEGEDDGSYVGRPPPTTPSTSAKPEPKPAANGRRVVTAVTNRPRCHQFERADVRRYQHNGRR